jgi:hypothetical protein
VFGAGRELLFVGQNRVYGEGHTFILRRGRERVGLRQKRPLVRL